MGRICLLGIGKTTTREKRYHKKVHGKIVSTTTSRLRLLLGMKLHVWTPQTEYSLNNVRPSSNRLELPEPVGAWPRPAAQSWRGAIPVVARYAPPSPIVGELRTRFRPVDLSTLATQHLELPRLRRGHRNLDNERTVAREASKDVVHLERVFSWFPFGDEVRKTHFEMCTTVLEHQDRQENSTTPLFFWDTKVYSFLGSAPLLFYLCWKTPADVCWITTKFLWEGDE